MKKPREGRSSQDTMLLSLLLGIAVIGVIGYLLFAQPMRTDTDSLSRYEYEGDTVSASDPVEDIPAMDAGAEDDEEAMASDAEADAALAAEEATQDEDEDEDDEEDAEETTAAQPAEFAAPTNPANVVRSYSVDALSYDETMQDWRTHAATDYEGESGDAVTAFTDGTVVEIGEDALRGTYIVLNHADDLQSCYAGITDVMVQEGDNVTCGQQIAKLGDPMPAEAEQGVHLHLELTKAGEPVDAESFLNTNSPADENA